MARVSGIGVAEVLAGVVLFWSGFKGQNLQTTLRGLLRGQAPQSSGQQPPTIGVSSASGSGASSSLQSAVGAGASAGAGSPAGHYDHASLMTLWRQAGGSAAAANNAACHAMQESSGDPKVTSGNPDGGTNVGLWQLDTRGVGAGYTVAQLQNPMTNAHITVMATRNGTNWSQWATPGC
jgi:hypothetical protein